MSSELARQIVLWASGFVERYPNRCFAGIEPSFNDLYQFQFVQALNHCLVDVFWAHVAHNEVVVKHSHRHTVGATQDGGGVSLEFGNADNHISQKILYR